MKELIKVSENKTVSARELYEWLGATERFSTWMEKQLQYGFVENQDFTSVKSFTLVNQGAKRELNDYALSIDCAKEISMLQRTDKGKEARQYFIECEKQLSQPKQISQAEYLLQQAKILFSVDSRLATIELERSQAKEYLEEKANEPIKSLLVTNRKALDNHMKMYFQFSGIEVPKLYDMLYKEFSLRYSINVHLKKKNSPYKTIIEWIECNGFITEAYGIAKELFSLKQNAA